MNKIQVINYSLRCQTLGVLSLIPFIGLVLVPVTWSFHQQVKKQAGREWNPAAQCLRRGYGLSFVSLFYQVLLILLVTTTDFTAQPSPGGT